MDPLILKELIAQGRSLAENLIEKASRTFGAVHKSAPIVFNGVKGALIWDYIAFNELTFISMDGSTLISLFTSWSDEKTEEEFIDLITKYGYRDDHDLTGVLA